MPISHISHCIVVSAYEYGQRLSAFGPYTEHSVQRGSFPWASIKLTNTRIRIFFSDRMTVIVTDSLWIKPTDALNSNFIGITTLHVSGSLSAHHQEFLTVHRLWYILCSCDEPFATRSRMELHSILLLVAHGHHNCIKCTTAEVGLRTPDYGQKGCPKYVES